MRRKLLILVCLFFFIGMSFYLEARRYPMCQQGCHKCKMNARQWEREMDDIDWSLVHLRNMQLRMRSQSIIHMDEGIRWQFYNGQFTESRRAFTDAEYEQQQAHVIQRKIDYLEKRREFLLKCQLRDQTH